MYSIIIGLIFDLRRNGEGMLVISELHVLLSFQPVAHLVVDAVVECPDFANLHMISLVGNDEIDVAAVAQQGNVNAIASSPVS